MSQIALIGIAATGRIIGDAEEKSGLSLHDFQENCSVSKNNAEKWSLKKTLQTKGKTFVDVNHSHLCLVGDETSAFGSEIQFRSEIERYAAEKFGIPMLQFVFGGGPNTVATTLGFQSAPNAFSCIVKGSGRFCHAIERCLEFESKLDNQLDKARVGWLLQTSMAKPDLSNHEFSQIKSIIDNKEKCPTPTPHPNPPTQSKYIYRRFPNSIFLLRRTDSSFLTTRQRTPLQFFTNSSSKRCSIDIFQI